MAHWICEQFKGGACTHSQEKLVKTSLTSQLDKLLLSRMITCRRGLWKLGIVEKLMEGRDGLTRAAKVWVASRDWQHVKLKRPLQLLYLLEIQHKLTLIDVVQPTLPSESDVNPCPTEAEKSTHPHRVAAVRAEQLRKPWISELIDDKVELGMCCM